MPPRVARGAASKRGAAAAGRGQPVSRGRTAPRGTRGAARGARGGTKPAPKVGLIFACYIKFLV